MNDDPDSPSSGQSPDTAIAVTVLDPDWRNTLSGVEALVRRAASAALAAAPVAVAPDSAEPAGAEVSVALADDATVARLNRDYRGADGPTNVLAFASGAAADGETGGPLLLGDVVLAYETVRREATDQRKRLPDHLCHLVIHGVLHLLGYDHQAEAEAAAMERLETEILAGLGIADPYRVPVAC